MTPYRIIITRMKGYYQFELVRMYDGAILAQAEGKSPVAPAWIREQQARLNTKAIMKTLGV